MTRSTAFSLIAIALAGFGIYRALYLPGMLVAPQIPLLVVVFFLQALFGIAAGVGVWLRVRWAALAIGLLCASIVAASLIGVILGFVAFFRALLEAAAAIVVAVLLIGVLRHRDDAARTSDAG
ncbi:hypothetical protein KJ059_01475 [Myxococcota bacterium]|nr:hypothetical protein [Myxococcota bacterium]MCZ7618330.1 hypothetical protein [Myxococcota bacterium]